jgi:hypothetical protein
LTLKEKFVFLEVASYDTVRSRQMALQHVDKVVFSQFAHIQEIGEESLRRVSSCARKTLVGNDQPAELH